MSTSSEYSDFSAQKSGKLSEKPSFSHKCCLLSQYLKEKGSFGDLSLGMTCNIEANGMFWSPQKGKTEMRNWRVVLFSFGVQEVATQTMSLFPVIQKPAEVSGRNMAAPRNLKSMDLFPQQTGFASSDSSVSKSVTPEPQTAQMTIFFGGQVLVFNDFPAKKANEIMLLASKESTQSYTAFASNLAPTQLVSTPNLPKNSTDSWSSVPPTAAVAPNFGNNIAQEAIKPSTAPVGCELPIARRASLHRFLEKRKDRITSKAPYSTGNPANGSSKPAEGKTWLGLAAQSPLLQ